MKDRENLIRDGRCVGSQCGNVKLMTPAILVTISKNRKRWKNILCSTCRDYIKAAGKDKFIGGRCGKCFEARLPNSSLCQEHYERRKVYFKGLARERHENSTCDRCGKAASVEGRKCLSCASMLREQAYQRHSPIKQAVLSFFSTDKGPACVCCGLDDAVEFLTIDHINGQPSKAERGYGFYNDLFRGKLTPDNKEKYQTLCFNCNSCKWFTHRNKGCSHKLGFISFDAIKNNLNALRQEAPCVGWDKTKTTCRRCGNILAQDEHTRCARCKVIHYVDSKLRYLLRKKKAFASQGSRCHCCGISDFDFLCLDHFDDNNGRAHRQKLALVYGSAFDAVYREFNRGVPLIEMGLRVSCFNCNSGRNARPDKICPHKL